MRQALVQTFKKEASQAGILHLAMHASLEDNDPLYSYLVFSKEDSVREHVLHTYELFNMDLAANLVVLSACHTGFGEIQKGEGILSLAKGFQYAGCPNLVMSLWQTDDKAAFKLMENFYKSFAKNQGYSLSLQQAKLAYLESEDRSHPYYWATFLYMGQRASLPRPSSLWWLLGIASLLAGAVYLGIRKWKAS